MSKVIDIIQQLQNLDPNSELIIAYWDKGIIEEWNDIELSSTQWSLITKKFSETDTSWGDDIDSIVSEVLYTEED